MRATLSFIVLLAGAGLSLWWLLSLQAARQNTEASVIDAPKLIVRNVNATQFNNAGVRQYNILAQVLTQWPDERGVTIARPQMQLYKDGEQLQWQLAAQRGWLAQDQSLLQLNQSIHAQRLTDDPSQALQFFTEQLNYYVEPQTLQTDAPVRLQSLHGVLQGRGLQGQLTQRHFELLAEVQGQYVLPHD